MKNKDGQKPLGEREGEKNMKKLTMTMTVLGMLLLSQGCGITLQQVSQNSREISRESTQATQERLREILTTLETLEDSLEQEFKSRQLDMLTRLRARYSTYQDDINGAFEKIVEIHNRIRQLTVALRDFNTNSLHDIESAQFNIDTTVQKLVSDMKAREIQRTK